MRSEDSPDSNGGEAERRPRRQTRKRPASAAERQRLHDEIREVDFRAAVRGYDRAAVDRYVTQVNNLIAELETSASPEGAVKHALEEVSEETRGILERAHEAADTIATRSRAAADDRLQRAEREAAEVRDAAERAARELREATQRETQELRATAEREARDLRATARREAEGMRAEAEARVQQLDQHVEAVWQDRRRLMDDLRTLAQQLLEIADNAAARFPPVAEVAARGELGSCGEPRRADIPAPADERPALAPDVPG